MVEINLFYDKKMIIVRIFDKNFIGFFELKVEYFLNLYIEKEIVEKLLDNFIGSFLLEELVKGKKDIVFISFDYICFVFLYIIILIILCRICLVNKIVRIWILVVIGFYCFFIWEELISKYGKVIVENEEIVMYIFIDDFLMVKIG